MNELTRMQYLAAMGIESFVPRRILPRARPSVRATLPRAATQASRASSGTDPATAPQRRHSSVASVVDEILTSGRKGAPPVAAADATVAQPETLPPEAERSLSTPHLDQLVSRAQAQDKAVQFTLHIWHLPSDLLVIDSHQTGSALPTNQLLSNILFAAGVATAPRRPDVLRWPAVARDPRPGGWREAGEMVAAFVASRLEHQPVKAIWCMGEDACRAMQLPRAFSETVGHALEAEEVAGDVPLLVMPSLADMLMDPSCKKQCWQALVSARDHGL